MYGGSVTWKPREAMAMANFVDIPVTAFKSLAETWTFLTKQLKINNLEVRDTKVYT